MKRLPAIAALFLLPGVAFGQVTAPSVSVTAGDQTLTVAWDEPSGATIGSAYDLWYILSSELSNSRSVPRGYSGLGAGSRDQPAMPVWTQLSDVASAKGDHYVILPRSLTNDAAYSVKVRHRQGTDDAWSTVVEGTPSEPSSTVALTLTLGTVVGGVVEGRDTDTYSATASSRTTMVCYVHAPNQYPDRGKRLGGSLLVPPSRGHRRCREDLGTVRERGRPAGQPQGLLRERRLFRHQRRPPGPSQGPSCLGQSRVPPLVGTHGYPLRPEQTRRRAGRCVCEAADVARSQEPDPLYQVTA